MDLKIFSTKLKYLRKKANLTQVQLAEMLHISQAQISRYETGLDEPSEDCLQALSAAFEIDGQSAAPTYPKILQTALQKTLLVASVPYGNITANHRKTLLNS